MAKEYFICSTKNCSIPAMWWFEGIALCDFHLVEQFKSTTLNIRLIKNNSKIVRDSKSTG